MGSVEPKPEGEDAVAPNGETGFAVPVDPKRPTAGLSLPKPPVGLDPQGEG